MAGNLNNVFDLAAGSMSSQLVRMNTIASNLANVGTVASTPVSTKGRSNFRVLCGNTGQGFDCGLPTR